VNIKKDNTMISNNQQVDVVKEDFLSFHYGNDMFTLWRLLDATKFAVSRLRDFELSKVGITPEQSAVLQAIMAENGKSTLEGISKIWLRQKNTVSTIIKRMEKQGLVETRMEHKRKGMEIIITPAGIETSKKITRISIESTFSVLSSEERQKLSLYLRLVLSRALNQLERVDRHRE
jgi:DNA-binding MarR family transcriptional regulator